MNDRQKVLILCTGNSARSQMAERLLRHIAGDCFEVASAGVAPTSVRQEAIEALEEINVSTEGLRSKSIDEFTAQKFDYLITVCDNANQNCPIFPGKAERIHWSIDDPAAVSGDAEERLNAFRIARDQLLDKLLIFAERC